MLPFGAVTGFIPCCLSSQTLPDKSNVTIFSTVTLTVLSFVLYSASTELLFAPVTVTLQLPSLCLNIISALPFGYNPLKFTFSWGTPISSNVTIIFLFGSITSSSPKSISPLASVLLTIELEPDFVLAFSNWILNVMSGITSSVTDALIFKSFNFCIIALFLITTSHLDSFCIVTWYKLLLFKATFWVVHCPIISL